MNNKKLTPFDTVSGTEVFHPGILLLEEVEERGLLKKDLARHLNILPNNLSQIFAGRRNVSVATALKLEKVFDRRAEDWLSLQYAYELQEARKMEMNIEH